MYCLGVFTLPSTTTTVPSISDWLVLVPLIGALRRLNPFLLGRGKGTSLARWFRICGFAYFWCSLPWGSWSFRIAYLNQYKPHLVKCNTSRTVKKERRSYRVAWKVLTDKRSSMAVHVGFVLLVYLEVLVFFEGRVQSKHHVQWLHQSIGQTWMHWDIQDIAGYPAVICQGEVNILAWGSHVRKQFLHFSRPNLHERVDIRHGFWVANRWWLFGLVDVSHWIYPL